MPRFAVIGGSGVYDPTLLEGIREEKLTNEFGSASVAIGRYRGREVAFMARHGAGHSVPPAQINYRANIRALKDLGVEYCISTSAVGSLDETAPPGSFVLVDGFLDFTKARPVTFFDGGDHGVAHVDVTDPYCPTLGTIVMGCGAKAGIEVRMGGTYVCCEGPRYETAAEIRMFQKLGGTVVGMTNVPECVLARESEICYRTICIVTNFAAGISPTKLTHKEVVELMGQRIEPLKRLVFDSLMAIDEGTRTCSCATALQGASG